MLPDGAPAVRLDGFVRQCLPHLSRQEIHRAIADNFFRLNGQSRAKGRPRAMAVIGSHLSARSDLLADAPLPASQLDNPDHLRGRIDSRRRQTRGSGDPWIFRPRPRRPWRTFLPLIGRRFCTSAKAAGSPDWCTGSMSRLPASCWSPKLKTRSTHCANSFAAGRSRKYILALVWGQPLEHGTIELALAHERGDKRRMVVVEQAERSTDRRIWRAITHYRVVGSAGGASLLEVEMVTGVTHQIRVHLSSNGYPIVGDALIWGRLPRNVRSGAPFLARSQPDIAPPGNRKAIKYRSGVGG